MMEVSGGTFALTRVVHFMANGDFVAIDLEFAAQRDGMKLAQSGIDVLRIENERVVEARLLSSDPEAKVRPRAGSAVAALDVLRCPRVARIEEQIFRPPMLHHFAEQHEETLVTGAPGLRHVVGNDDDRIPAA